MRRAFYAGYWSFLQMTMNMLEPGTDATENDLKAMSEIHQELCEFYCKVKAGAA